MPEPLFLQSPKPLGMGPSQSIAPSPPLLQQPSDPGLTPSYPPPAYPPSAIEQAVNVAKEAMPSSEARALIDRQIAHLTAVGVSLAEEQTSLTYQRPAGTDKLVLDMMAYFQSPECAKNKPALNEYYTQKYPEDMEDRTKIALFWTDLNRRRLQMFCGPKDSAVLAGHHESLDGDIGDGRSRFTDIERSGSITTPGGRVVDLNAVLSYSEITMLALLISTSENHPLNSGDRENWGIQRGDDHQEVCITSFVAGSRLEKPGYAEYRFMVVDREQNTEEKGYGERNADELQIWARFYGVDRFYSFNEVDVVFKKQKSQQGQLSDEESKILQRFSDIGNGRYLDLKVHNARLKKMKEAEFGAKSEAIPEGKKGFLHISPEGMGVWAVDREKQPLEYVRVVKELVDGGKLNKFAAIDFSYLFGKGNFTKEQIKEVLKVLGYPENVAERFSSELIMGSEGVVRFAVPYVVNGQEMRLIFSHSDPNLKLERAYDGTYKDCMLFNSVAGDGAAVFGNEFAVGAFGASGDPAACAAGTAWFTHSPYANSFADAICYFGKDFQKSLHTIAQYSNPKYLEKLGIQEDLRSQISSKCTALLEAIAKKDLRTISTTHKELLEYLQNLRVSNPIGSDVIEVATSGMSVFIKQFAQFKKHIEERVTLPVSKIKGEEGEVIDQQGLVQPAEPVPAAAPSLSFMVPPPLPTTPAPPPPPASFDMETGKSLPVSVGMTDKSDGKKSESSSLGWLTQKFKEEVGKWWKKLLVVGALPLTVAGIASIVAGAVLTATLITAPLGLPLLVSGVALCGAAAVVASSALGAAYLNQRDDAQGKSEKKSTQGVPQGENSADIFDAIYAQKPDGTIYAGNVSELLGEQSEADPSPQSLVSSTANSKGQGKLPVEMDEQKEQDSGDKEAAGNYF